jgi:hypothetical protein
MAVGGRSAMQKWLLAGIALLRKVEDSQRTIARSDRWRRGKTLLARFDGIAHHDFSPTDDLLV